MKKTMRISRLRLGFLALAGGAMLLVSGCSQEEFQVPENENLIVTNDTQNRAPGPSASGQGTLTLDDLPIAGEGFRHFAFQARMIQGNPQGSGILSYQANQAQVRFDIDCLEVNGNIATMTGVITHHAQFPERVGWTHWFQVEDNGAGNNSDPDRITLWFQSSGTLVCTDDLGVALYEIEGGNIQVRD